MLKTVHHSPPIILTGKVERMGGRRDFSYQNFVTSSRHEEPGETRGLGRSGWSSTGSDGDVRSSPRIGEYLLFLRLSSMGVPYVP